MARYFVDIRDGDDVATDKEGEEFPTLDAARTEAILSAREMFAEAANGGASIETLNQRWFEIRDYAGEIMLRISFREAIEDLCK